MHHCHLFYSVVSILSPLIIFFFFFNDTATTEIYTLSLHDALPIYGGRVGPDGLSRVPGGYRSTPRKPRAGTPRRQCTRGSEAALYFRAARGLAGAHPGAARRAGGSRRPPPGRVRTGVPTRPRAARRSRVRSAARLCTLPGAGQTEGVGLHGGPRRQSAGVASGAGRAGAGRTSENFPRRCCSVSR